MHVKTIISLRSSQTLRYFNDRVICTKICVVHGTITSISTYDLIILNRICNVFLNGWTPFFFSKILFLLFFFLFFFFSLQLFLSKRKKDSLMRCQHISYLKTKPRSNRPDMGNCLLFLLFIIKVLL